MRRGWAVLSAWLGVAGGVAAQIPCADWLPGHQRSAPTNPTGPFEFVRVDAVAVHDDGSGESLHIATSPGGDFPPNSGQRYVYRLNGGVFERLGGDFVNFVECFGFFNGELYVGGAFPAKIARWDGAAWIPLPPFPDHATVYRVSTIGSFQGRLVVGIQDSTTRRIVASLDGGQWTTLAVGGLPSYVGDLEVFQGELIAAGEFHDLNGNPAIDYIARFDGTIWRPMLTSIQFDSGFTYIESLTIHNGELIAGGFFRAIDGVESRAVIRWNGTQWLPIGSGIQVPYYRSNAVISVGGALYQTGSHWPFSPDGCAGNFSRWTGGEWEYPGGCLSGYDFNNSTYFDGYGVGMVAFSDLAVVCGGFEIAGGQGDGTPAYQYPNLAAWNGEQWVSATGAVDPNPNDIEVFRGQMHACGDGGTVVNPLFVFDGLRWNRIPLQPPDVRPDYIRCIEVYGDRLFAGGERYYSNGPRLASWDGEAWSAPVEQPNDDVNALATIGEDLYVGGGFTMIGEMPAPHIARWDGVGWQTLGLGLSSANGFPRGVFTIAPFRGKVFAGGTITNSAGSPMLGIAQWDGGEWSQVGEGLSRTSGSPIVWALAEYEDSLYVGGTFTGAGEAVAVNFARWDGMNWSSVPGPTLNGNVRAMRPFGGSLFLGGTFDMTHNGQTLIKLARFDGTDWFSVDGGLTGYNTSLVYDFEELGETLFICGAIGTIGPQPHGAWILRWGYDPISGDADADGDADMADVCSVLTNFNAMAPPGGFVAGDADRNRSVNFRDVTAVLRSFGQLCAP
jgi:hypothetical protein